MSNSIDRPFVERLYLASVWQKSTGWSQRKADMRAAAATHLKFERRGFRGMALVDRVRDELMQSLRGPQVDKRVTLCILTVMLYEAL
ncbi:MAG: hypothetical protein JSS25_05160 [Proteobacteria bacterium]|nr:hypothetical protein [Pseudomonadota bacterium]